MVDRLQEQSDNIRGIIAENAKAGYSKHIPLSSSVAFGRVTSVLSELKIDFRTYNDNLHGAYWGSHVFIRPEDARPDVMSALQSVIVGELSSSFPNIREQIGGKIDRTIN